MMILLPVRPSSISPPIRSIFFLFLHNLYPSNHKQSIKYVLFSHFFAKSVLSALFSCLRNLGASYSFMGSILPDPIKKCLPSACLFSQRVDIMQLFLYIPSSLRLHPTARLPASCHCFHRGTISQSFLRLHPTARLSASYHC
mgnify:CR=1 FL=1